VAVETPSLSWKQNVRGLAGLLLCVGALGCSSLPVAAPARLLAQADREARDGAWEQALRSYDEYLARFPDDRAAPRGRESRETLAAMLAARAEVTRQREEVVRLRADIERLKEIDLKVERKR
jgi:hypothetical protein